MMPLGSWACHVGHSNVWVISDWSRWFVEDMHNELCLARSDASPGVVPHQECCLTRSDASPGVGCPCWSYASARVTLIFGIISDGWHVWPGQRVSRRNALPGDMPRQGGCLARKLASPRVIPRQEARLAAGMPRQDVCLEVVLREAAMMLEAAPRASPTPYVGPNFVGARPWDAAPTCGTELCLWAVAPTATSDRTGGTEKSSVPHLVPHADHAMS